MSYTVYKHTTPSNKVYIGITGQNPVKRWGGQGQGYYGQIFYKAIKKYGWNSIRHEILYSGLSRKEAIQKEQELIGKCRSTEARYGYNISVGGYATRLGHICSEATKKKISQANKGKMAWDKGKHLPEEARRKISEKAMGRTPWNKGLPRTDEEKKKMAKALKGKVAWNKGRHWTEAERQKIIQAVQGRQETKPVICLETKKQYLSACHAAKDTGLDRSGIAKCCRGVNKTVGGYHWSFT